jgi:hypothetical protein
MSGKSGKIEKKCGSSMDSIFWEYEERRMMYYCMSSSEGEIFRHNVWCGCDDPNREEKLYASSEKLASEMGAEKMTHNKRDDLKEGDIMIFNGVSHEFARYSTHFDPEARSGNYCILFKDRKEVLYDLFGVWETNNQHRIPYDHVYVVFNKK